MRICSETHLFSWHNKEFVQVISTELLLAFNPAASRRLVTFPDFTCVLLHYDAFQLAFDQPRFQTQRDSFSFGYMTPFDLTPRPLAFNVHLLNRLGSFSTNSAAAATAETAETVSGKVSS